MAAWRSRSYHHQVGIFLFLLLRTPFAFSAHPADVNELLDSQEEQLRKLKGLVDALSVTVHRLESALSSQSTAQAGLAAKPKATSSVPVVGGSTTFSTRKNMRGARLDGPERSVAGLGPGGVASVTKSRPLWLDRFKFLAAVRLEAGATAALVLPYTDANGLSKYVAIGDGAGRVYVFSSAGDLLLESQQIPASPPSPVTTLLCYLALRRNESFLFTGHADGSILRYPLWEPATPAAQDASSSLSIGSPATFFHGGGDNDDQAEEPSPVACLEMHQVGRVRFLVVADELGRIRAFTENGTLHGAATASSRPLAFMKQRTLFLTETGAGWLDLRRMILRETECQGLNGSLSKGYAFDLTDRRMAYGVTSDGDLVHAVLIGDAGGLKCRVRALKKLEDADGSISLLSIRGYLLLLNREKVFLYNVSTSTQYYTRIAASRSLLFATLAELKSSFLTTAHHAPASRSDDTTGEARMPVVAGDREKLVVLDLGDNYVGIYRSDFPVIKKVQSNTVLWSSPFLMLLMFLVGACYLYVRRASPLGWTAEEPFTAVSPSTSPSTSLLGSSAGGVVAFSDGQRAGDLQEVRERMLRSPSRRYSSPSSRYTTGETAMAPYRRPPPSVSADPAAYAGNGELKYKGRPLEPPGFPPKRKEPIFTSNSVLEDHID